jgi:putative Mn2+ efflux pump MntP
MHSLATVISLGLDSFLVCTVIGITSLSWRERWYLACAFGAWDAFGSLLGSIELHGSLQFSELITFGLAVFLYVCCAPRNRWLLFVLPILFCLDNLLTKTPLTMTPVIGLSSATMALVGFSLGAGCRHVATAFLTRIELHSAQSVAEPNKFQRV